MKGIKNLNRTLNRVLRYKVMKFKDFKKMYGHCNCWESLNGAIAHIEAVERDTYGYKFTFESGDTLRVYFTGHFQKNNMNPVRNIDNRSGRVRINQFNGFNTSMFPEKAIGIAELILNDELPHTFDGLAVNVMDGSGNDLTAWQLGIIYDVHPENLEWTLIRRNTRHGQAIKKLAEITGHVYKFSANDDVIYDALDVKKHQHNWIRHYMLMNYPKSR